MNKVWRTPIKDEAGVYVGAQQAKKLARELSFDEVGRACLETIALELARNALIHGGGGEIQLGLLCDEKRIGVEIQVTDNGPGIEPLDMLKIWYRGFSTFGTSGLGLDIIKRRVEEIGWRIEANSEPNDLTTFRLYIHIEE